MAVSLLNTTVLVSSQSPRQDEDGDGDKNGDGNHKPDDLYTVLANRRRRFVIHRLLQTDDECKIRDLSQTVAAWEYGKTPSEVSTTERHRVYNSLQQLHLPKLDAYGFVNYDHNRGTVRATDELNAFTVYLEVVPRSDISWSTYYLLLGVFTFVLNFAAWTGTGPFSLVPLAATTFLTVGLFLVSALFHARFTHKQRVGVDGLPPELDS